MNPLRRLKHLAAGEVGFAMPTVIMATTVVLMLVAFAATRANDANDSTNQDRLVKVALQAADSGVEATLERQNEYADRPAGQPCVIPSGTSLVGTGYASGNWCPPVTDDFADGTSAVSQLSGPTVSGGTTRRSVVSTGLVKGLRRRVVTTLTARTGGTSLFGNYGISAKDDVLMENNSVTGTSEINVNVRSNGTLTLKNHAQVCGMASAGPGRTVTDDASPDCAVFQKVPVTEPLVFPPYDRGNVITVNDNARICAAGGDACHEPHNVKREDWSSPAKRQLIIENAAKVTLGGDNYHFCRLNLKNNSELIIAPRATGAVRIFLGGPECEFEEMLMIENNIGITNLNSSPVTLQIFAYPNKDGKSKLNIKNNAANPATTPLVMYAPDSDIIIENNVSFTGAVVGRTVHIKNNVKINRHGDTGSILVGETLIYQPTRYSECAPNPQVGATDPTAGC